MKQIVAAWIISLSLLALVHNNVSGLQERIAARVIAMKQQVDSARTFRERIERMRPVTQEFTDAIPATTSAKDISDIYRLLEIPPVLAGTPERVAVASVTEVQVNEKPIGVVSVCLNSGAGAFLLRTEDLAAGLTALKTLLSKPWISASEVAIEATPGRKTVLIQLSGFCLYLRS